MFNLSENYHLRKCFLQREQVPTQSMMREKMSPALAAVYFKSMTPRLKELAGLEPRLTGGGTNWYQPPEELLTGRAVLKPIKKQVLTKLNSQGIGIIGTSLFQRHRRAMDLATEQAILDSDEKWRNAVVTTTRRVWEDLVAEAKRNNTEHIKNEFNQFVYLYRQSLGKIEILFHESAIAEINNARENSLHEMQMKYATALKHQATLMYDEFEKKLMEEKTRLKDEFVLSLENNRTAMAEKIHDLKVDKHTALNKIGQSLHNQNLACQIYVSLKEREEFLRETDELKYEHKKNVKIMTDTILRQDFQIHLAEEKEKKRQEFCNIWRKKVCEVVKAFQTFVSRCLNMFPEQAEFFINMEKMMFLQLNEALKEPSAASIIEVEGDGFHTPVPRPKPFYLFCDKGYKPKLEEDLCPKPSGASSLSDMPVIIVNKQCLYAACDNFNQFTNKIKEYIHGKRGDDADFTDDLVYEHFVPVKYTDSQQLLEIKLESSLVQVLQEEIAHVQTYEDVPVMCKGCELPWCSCRTFPTLVHGGEKIKSETKTVTTSEVPLHKLRTVDRSVELIHEREPKWDSFCRHVEPKKCSCAMLSKKHLAENLPAYMRHMRYGPPEVPEYEMCSLKELKALVKEARKESPIPIPVPVAVLSKTKDMSTECYDPRFEVMCTCNSDDEFSKFIDAMKLSAGQKIKLDAMSPSFMTQDVRTFATTRARSLRNLVDEFSELEYIFKKVSCDF